MATTTPLNAEPATLRHPKDPAPPYYVRGLALGIPAYLIGIHLWTWVFMLPTFLGGRSDFRQLYTAGFMLRSGHAHELYDYGAQHYFQNKLVSPGDIALPFNHPAYEALFFLPFSLLSYRAAYLAFLGVNLAVLGITFWLLQPWTENLRQIYRWLPGALFLAFLPICAALIQGQDSILLLLLVTCALRFLRQEQEFAAGLLMAVGLFKLQLVLPVAVLFLIRKRWRFVAGFSIVGLTVVGVSLFVAGVSQSIVYLRSLHSMSVQLASASDQFKYGINLIAMPNVRGLLFGLTHGHLSNLWVQLLTIVLSCALLGWAGHCTARGSAVNLILVAVTVSTLVSYHMLIHDMAILLVPILATLDCCVYAEGSGNLRERWKFRAAALAFTAPLLMSWAPRYFFLAAIPVLFFMLAISNAPSGREPGWSTS